MYRKFNFAAFIIAVLIASFTANGQIIYQEIESQILNETRKIKIQLPRNYTSNTEKVYPIILVFDADYLFEPVAGNVDYYSYWEEMPEAVVVGIMQGDQRNFDGQYDTTSYFPEESGARFFEFIGLELIPHIDKEYRTAKFILAIGHEYMGNFINYYLFKDPPLFNGYICLSPELAPTFEYEIPKKLSSINHKIFYYLATAENDLKDNRLSSLELHQEMSKINRKEIYYYFDDFEGASHYSLVGKAIPNALENIFSIYRPISKKDFDEVIMQLETPLIDYITDKYNTIKTLFGFKIPYKANDIIAVATAAEKKKQWTQLEAIGKLAKKELSKSMIGDYYIGRYFEETGDPKKALRTYRAALDKEDVGFINVDLLLDRIDKIKLDFGY
ncbi:MAG TPA: alpha/beta hydrolase-fold protein [Flavobacteriaceae bacterium]|nr:alpha/beta hydrolase-fold protein [Flavobacteriaceae bacterium]